MRNENRKTCLKDPAELTIHPLAKTVPEWSKDDPRFIALVEDIRARGIDHRILIDKENRIVDGRSVWRAAKQLQIDTLECAFVEDEDIAGAVLAGLLHRRHLTKGQRAYVAYPFLQPVFEESARRRSANLRNNPNPIESLLSGLSGKTVADYAAQLGIGRNLFFQAAEVHKLFANNRKFEWNDERKPLTLREYYEPRILDDEDPTGLGAVIAGIASKLSPATASQNKSGQMELFTDAFDTLKKRFSYWGKFDSRQKQALKPVIQELIEKMPLDLCEQMVNAAKQRLKEAMA